ncbi:uncharacterized protein LOC126844653 [Adelges cooleyi]|uniref:uncharacterized protein LOC126844653 n=1 Tax=Adelges cooleyi TaxID=133065 RepID=UPI00217FB3D7|nr:uncharacterized protein LOC126844653 [Adelges cooleyi]XP_050438951.1 uncharacterized protein LOC126844653 [Adelges cooleyi]XP_050438952.1 uncharacterized protein LOC126844653 [Adelges cooleyi]
MLSTVKEPECNAEEIEYARSNTTAEDNYTHKTIINSTLENDNSNKPKYNRNSFKEGLPMPDEVKKLEELTSTILFQSFSCKIFEKVKKKTNNTKEIYLEHFKCLNKEVVQIIAKKVFNDDCPGIRESDKEYSEENLQNSKIDISTLRTIQFILK